MKLSYAVYFVGVIYVLYQAGRGAHGQDFHNGSLVFENITFDMVNYGAYNISFCIEEMLNCWEAVKPDIICEYYYNYHASMCSKMREKCAEFYGDEEWGQKGFYYNEQTCWSWSTYHFT